MALTNVAYGYKNLQFDTNTGKIYWLNNLVVLGQGAIEPPSASTVVFRDDLTSQQEAVNSSGIPLPLDTILVANITAVASVLTVEFHVEPILLATTESDTWIHIAYNIGGQVMNKFSQPWNYEDVVSGEAKSYADSIRRSDQDIIDLVTGAGVQISDYETAFVDRIGSIIDKAMGSAQIDTAFNKMKESWDKMNLTGDKRAELEANFYNQLTSNVITTAIGTAQQSMLTQQQAELAKRQKQGFSDNLLVKATENLGNTIALINSGSSNANPTNWKDYDQAIAELKTRSRVY